MVDDSSQHAATIRDDLARAGTGFEHAAAAAQHTIAKALFGRAASSPPAGPLVAGRYRIGEKLGAGGQGAVWRARDETLGRDVAIKINHVDHTANLERAQEWMRHEAKMLGRISHPNVIAVFDVGLHAASAFGSDDDGMVIFVVLELVRGRNLLEWLAERPRAANEIGAVFVAIASGLQAVHDAGLVHCDVKPGNIMVTAGGIAKLGDFGLAHTHRRLAGPAADEVLESLVERTGHTDAQPETSRSMGPVGGTPTYMPPEQFTHRRVDARADQYALAATWFCAMFGSAPHRGNATLALLTAKLEGAPEQPSKAMSSSAYAALARALEPDPDRRYTDVRDFAQAVTRTGRSGRSGIAAGIAVVFVALVVTMTTATAKRPGCTEVAARPPSIDAELAGDRSMYERQLAQRAVDRWSAHTLARDEARRSVCNADPIDDGKLACLDRHARLVEGSLGTGEIRGRHALERVFSVLERLPEAGMCLQNSDAALASTGDAQPIDDEIRSVSDALVRAEAHRRESRPAEALAIVTAIDRASPAAVAYLSEIDLIRASALHSLAHLDDAAAAYREVWDRSIDGNAPLDAVRAASGLASVVGFEQHDLEAGIGWIRHGQSQLERFGGAPELEAELLGVSAMMLSARGDHVAALAELERAIELASAGNKAILMGYVENAGLIEVILDDLDGAAHRLTTVRTWREAQLGPWHPDVARSLTNIAYLERRRGNPSIAAQHLARAREIYDGLPDASDLEIARIESSLGRLALEQGEPQRALEAFARAEALRDPLLPADHPDRAALIVSRLEALMLIGDVAGADALAQRSRDALGRMVGADAVAALAIEQKLAEVDANGGRLDAALLRMTRVIEQAEERRLATASLASWCATTAVIAGKLGDIDAAETWADRAETHFAAYGGDAGVPEQIASLRRAIAEAGKPIE